MSASLPAGFALRLVGLLAPFVASLRVDVLSASHKKMGRQNIASWSALLVSGCCYGVAARRRLGLILAESSFGLAE